MNMAGPTVDFTEDGRRKLAFISGIAHWLCIIPSFICLLTALYIQIVIEENIVFIENYEGAVLPGFLVFSGFYGFMVHVTCGKVLYTNRIIHKRKKWAPFLFATVIATIILFLSELTTGILCFTHIKELETSMDRGIKVAMAAYKNDATIKEQLDMLQITYECCGSRRYTQWFYVEWIHPDYAPTTQNKRPPNIGLEKGFIGDNVPFSCCTTNVLRPCINHHVHQNDLQYRYDYAVKTTLNTIGCTDKLMTIYKDSLLTLAGAIVVGLSFLQLFLSIASRFIQTAIATSLAGDNLEGFSVGYLFTYKPTAYPDAGLNTTAETISTNEERPLLDTTVETTMTQDIDRFVNMDVTPAHIYGSHGNDSFLNMDVTPVPVYDTQGTEGTDRYANMDAMPLLVYGTPGTDRYVNMNVTPVPVYETQGNDNFMGTEVMPEPIYEEIPPLTNEEELMYNRGNDEAYLAASFAHSRETFQHFPPADVDQRSPPLPSHPPTEPIYANVDPRSLAPPSLMKVKSNQGSYMAMNSSNSCFKNGKFDLVNITPSYKLQPPLDSRKFSSPISHNNNNRKTYVINMLTDYSPVSRRELFCATSPRHSSLERRPSFPLKSRHLSPSFKRRPLSPSFQRRLSSPLKRRHLSPSFKRRHLSPSFERRPSAPLKRDLHLH